MHIDLASRATARRGLGFVVLAGILWGTSGPASKAIYGLVDINPLTIVTARNVVAAPILLLVARWGAAGRTRTIARRDLLLMLLVGVALGLSDSCYYAAIAHVGVVIATLVTVCTTPVLVCLLSALLLRERLTPAVGAALACALLGTVLLVGVGQPGAGVPASVDPAGILFSLGSALGFATFIMTSRALASRYDPLQSIAVGATAAALLLVAVSAVAAVPTFRYPLPAWALLAFLGLVPSALAYAVFFHGMQTAGASEASIATLAEPLTSTVLALVLFHEQLGPLALLGAALLIAVLVFLYQAGPSSSG
jgi:drug/metabolite transporter, DME family